MLSFSKCPDFPSLNEIRKKFMWTSYFCVCMKGIFYLCNFHILVSMSSGARPVSWAWVVLIINFCAVIYNCQFLHTFGYYYRTIKYIF